MTNVTKLIISVFDRAENIVGKGEIACTSNFSFSHNVYKRLLFQTHQNVSLCGNGFKRNCIAKCYFNESWTQCCAMYFELSSFVLSIKYFAKFQVAYFGGPSPGFFRQIVITIIFMVLVGWLY